MGNEYNNAEYNQIVIIKYEMENTSFFCYLRVVLSNKFNVALASDSCCSIFYPKIFKQLRLFICFSSF